MLITEKQVAELLEVPGHIVKYGAIVKDLQKFFTIGGHTRWEYADVINLKERLRRERIEELKKLIK